MVEVVRSYFLSCGDIWCSILVYHYLFAVCALLVSLVLLFHIKGIISSCVVMVLMKCVELKYIAFYLPCARFILFVICGAACILIMRYRAF